MRVLVCGSRDWDDIHAIRIRFVVLYGATVFIHGGAPGADRIAGFLAEDFGFTVREFPANWDNYGKTAGILRNLQMLDECPDLVLAFQRNHSRGTQHTIVTARRRDIPVEVHR